ncbi:MAG: MIT C-terminal domain-containing protein [Verrucomicrobiota bacterium]
METLFAGYMRGADVVSIEDAFLVRPYQIANLLRFCELLVRLGTIRTIKLLTKEITDDSRGGLETIRLSLKGHNVDFSYAASAKLHDRRISTDTGWEINLGRGLDFYKAPNDWLAVGATDFALRPCFQTTIIFHRLGQQAQAMKNSA